MMKSIMAEWRVYSKKSALTKARLLVLTIKRQGQLKKLCWKILAKNSRVRRKDRQDTQHATLFFYYMVMKKSFKVLVRNMRAR